MRATTQKAEPWASKGEIFENTEEPAQKSLRECLPTKGQKSHASEEENVLVRESQTIPAKNKHPDSGERHRFGLYNRQKYTHVCVPPLQLRRWEQSMSFSCVDVTCK